MIGGEGFFFIGEYWSYMVSLLLIGLGWNFGFIGGTALLTETYAPAEKEKVQALNDFLIFGVVALASFSSGAILVIGGWNVVNLAVLPVTLVCLGALVWQVARRPHSA